MTRVYWGTEAATWGGQAIYWGATTRVYWGTEAATWGGQAIYWGATTPEPPEPHTPGIVVTDPARDLDTIIAAGGPRLVRAEFLTGPAAGEDAPITAGSVTVDMAADVRRTAGISVAGIPQWVPSGPGHPLDPRSGSRLQLWQGVVDDTDTAHWWSQGVYVVTRSSVDESEQGLSISCDLADLAHPIRRAGIRRRWAASASDPILASVALVLAEVAPWADIRIDLDGDFEFGTDSVIAEYGDDVWSKCVALARSMSRDLHVDRDGVVVAPPLVDPLTAEPVPMLGLTARAIELDSDDVVNVVGCPWTQARPDDAGENWVPAGGVEEWVDETSSTSIHSPIGTRVGVCGGDISVVHTAAHARLAAQADGITRLGLQQAAAGSKIPDPRDDVGIPVDVDGTTHVVSRLTIDLAGSATSVDLGASRPDIALMMAATTRPPEEYRTTEIVTGLSPLRSRSVTDPGRAEVAVMWTDALAGVEVGDPITVLHKGAGLRVGVAVLVKKPLADKHAGEQVGSVGGKPLSVGGDVQLRVRAQNNQGTTAYSTYSGGDVTVQVPNPPPPPDMSNYYTKSASDLRYTQRNGNFVLPGAGWNPTFPGVPATYDQAWMQNIQYALIDLRTIMNGNRGVYYSY